MSLTHRRRKVAALSLASVTLLLVSACSSSGTTSETSSAAAPESSVAASESSAAAPSAEAVDGADLVAALPTELQALYANTTDPVGPAAYDDFVPPAEPWKVCFADSFQGNPWRVAVKDELQRLSDDFKAYGVDSFEVAVSDGKVDQQIAQIRAFVDKGCSIILTIPESATGINDAIKAAYDAGIPVVSFAGAVTSPYAINVNSNYYAWGYDMAKAICDENPSANVLMVHGIDGQPVAVAEEEGAKAAFAECPDINVVAEVNGDWTPSTTKSAVLTALATNPGQIDAVWTTGSEARIVADAFNEAGRPAPLITASLTGDTLGYWNENQDSFKFAGGAVVPSVSAQPAFRVAMRMLNGQKPSIITMMAPIPPASTDTLADWYKECMTADSATIFPVAPSDPLPEELMDAYFSNGAALNGWDYATTPDPCAAS
jgi:ribose transport system substrate-binding protein